MFIFSVVALLLLAAVIAYKNNCDISLSLPVTTGGLILVLYILAYFRALGFIDILGILIIVAVIAVSVLNAKKQNAQGYQLPAVLKHVATPISLVMMIGLAVLTISQLGVKASWWDDLNYWATDAKALYYLEGFSGKYGNVAPEFGDYPPALSLFKWFFMHFSNTYVEGLGYSAYQCLNFILIVPLFHNLGRGKWKHIPFYALGCVVLYYIPSVCNVVGYEGACADVTMALLYGNLLWFIWQLAQYYKGTQELPPNCKGAQELPLNCKGTQELPPYFIIAGVGIFSAVLVLTKSVGIEWVAYAFIFFILLTRGINREHIKYIAVMWLLPLICEGSWMSFCLLNRRVAKLTSSGVHMVTSGNMDVSGYAAEKAGYFVRGYMFEPMHTGHSGVIDLPASCYLILILAVLILLTVRKTVDRSEGVKLIVYTIATAVLAYGIIFVGHITIFAAETQYSSSDIMAISMSRYAAPFTLGMLMFLMHFMLDRSDNLNLTYIVLAAFVLVTCEYITPFKAITGNQMPADEIDNIRLEMTKDATPFITAVASDDSLWGRRVLYLRDDHKAQWVSSAYINLECAPVAVVYGGIANDTMTRDDMEYILSSSHASYLYSDEVEGDATALFEGMLDGEFEYNRLYKIDGGRLIAAE